MSKAQDERKVFRDVYGQIIGTAETECGITVYRDKYGIPVASATFDGDWGEFRATMDDLVQNYRPHQVSFTEKDIAFADEKIEKLAKEIERTDGEDDLHMAVGSAIQRLHTFFIGYIGRQRESERPHLRKVCYTVIAGLRWMNEAVGENMTKDEWVDVFNTRGFVEAFSA